MLPPLYGLPPAELALRLSGAGRARAVWDELRAGRDPFHSLDEGPRRRLQAAARPTPARRLALTRSEGGTAKVLLGFESGEAEAVLIPSGSRTTLCVSTQIGCARGCIFCLTGTMGRVRNLDAGEIVAQVLEGRALVGELSLPPLRNVVVMGMGEPLDNAAELALALEVMVSREGLRLPERNLTVSTVGPSPRQILAAGSLPGRLAWSVHAADDELRRRLVPTSRFPMADLRDAFVAVLANRRQPLLVEVTLIDGLNDGPEHAAELVELLRPFEEPRVNLLPMNPIGTELRPSSGGSVRAFQQVVRSAGMFCSVRRARGDEARSACGQLAIL